MRVPHDRRDPARIIFGLLESLLSQRKRLQGAIIQHQNQLAGARGQNRVCAVSPRIALGEHGGLRLVFAQIRSRENRGRHVADDLLRGILGVRGKAAGTLVSCR